ncbi:feruloyl-CoA synthase [Falsiroseomonas sp. HW251]|uniref:feruloyl-CoA synthase n=1 Tax=Falsiroseomonas sp. HW251 TaxID=3390998 RepID=UPI003D31D20C
MDALDRVRIFAPPRIGVTQRADGAFIVRSEDALPPDLPRVTDHLFAWARRAPDRPFLMERAGEAWRGVTYAEAADAVRRIGAALLARGLTPTRGLAVLSGNSVNHALIGLAAQAIGVPYAPVSPPYSLLSEDLAKLRHILGLLKPGLIHVERAAPFARALAIPEAAVEVVATDPAGVDRARPFAELLAHDADTAVEAAIAAVDPEAAVKVLFTSGSTGLPKGVITNHRMMAANQAQIAAAWSFLSAEPPVLLDWLPWSHVFGCSHNVNMMMRNGGTLWIDAGKPLPGEIEHTIRNIREVPATISMNVPKGYELLIPRLEQDEALARAFFARLRVMLYAGAALAPPLWKRLEDLARRHAPDRVVPMISSWGLTETSPAITSAHLEDAAPGCIGVPLTGLEIKLIAEDDKLEARVRGANIFPGYFKNPEATAAAFDEEGFFRTGDAIAWIDPADPNKGFRFNGRLTEDFKLSSGTRVNAGEVRICALAALSEIARDVLVVGENKDDIGLLLIPHDHRRAELGTPALAEATSAALQALNSHGHHASSREVVRALFLVDPPSLDAGEITDKGSLNIRAILRRRAADYERLFDDGDAAVIRP